MPEGKRWLWPLLKLMLAAALLFFVGRQFYKDLTRNELQNLAWRPAWLALSAACYLLFLGTSAWFWRRLLHRFGHALPFLAAFRAYYVSQLGKYVPGKAIALFLRGVAVRPHGVPLSLAVLTSFYEVLTTMAAGALLAALAFLAAPPRGMLVLPGIEIHPALAGALLMALLSPILVPAVFNPIVRRLARRATSEGEPMPAINLITLLEGLLMTALGWCLLGIAVWSGLCAVLPAPPELTLETWSQFTGIVGLAYVGGFLAVFMPGGLGVREEVFRQLLAFAGPSALVAAAVLLMRLAWTIAEVASAGVLYLVPDKPRPPLAA
jgi:uncharacterized membrane protein YbhN (UPF0104 family)